MTNNLQHVLIVTEGPGVGQSYVLQGMVCTLGRTPDNNVVIDSARISRHHAQIRLLPSGAVIEDMGSTNGTWVNGRQISAPHPLAHGDEVGLADFITFRYEAEDTAKTERMSPVSSESAPTQVMGDMPNYPSIPKPPTPAYEDSAPTQYDHEVPPPEPPPAPVSLQDEPARPQRSKWLYVGIAVLVILLCLCVAAGVYLWFAPEEFWIRLFEMIGWPWP